MPKKKATPPVFIGIDLAWSDRNPTGAAVICQERLVAYTGNLAGDADVLAFVAEHVRAGGPAVVAVDAPLRVPNERGSRACDREVSRDWRSFDAGALPANRLLFSRKVGRGDVNPVRGERLVAALVGQMRFTEAAVIPKQSQDRLVCEVFPHPALVSLFGLEKTLKYKSRRGRSLAGRQEEMARYQLLLRSLRQAQPALKRTKALLVGTDVSTLRGAALKAHEDILDAITCAYIGAYLWHYGPRRAITYGSLPEGSILVPVTAQIKERLAGKSGD